MVLDMEKIYAPGDEVRLQRDIQILTRFVVHWTNGTSKCHFILGSFISSSNRKDTFVALTIDMLEYITSNVASHQNNLFVEGFLHDFIQDMVHKRVV